MEPLDDHEDQLPDESSTESTLSDDNEGADRQLRDESQTSLVDAKAGPDEQRGKWCLPPHLDPEWLAFEVFTKDEDDTSSDGEETEDESDKEESPIALAKPRLVQRSSLDSGLISQIRDVSIRSSPGPMPPGGASQPLSDLQGVQFESQESFVARSPFSTIISSLSLLEMLIRLSSLQEFQQAPHLAIPDHILNFFLEETSTTGLIGAERRRVRHEAKRRVGFDPYTDTPGK